MELDCIVQGKYQVTLIKRPEGFFSKIQELGQGHIWTSEIVNFQEKDYKKLTKFQISKFFEINKEKEKVVFNPGLSGGGCFGSKAKVIDTQKIVKTKTLSNPNVQPVTSKPLKETEKDTTTIISSQTDEKSEEISKISLLISEDLENFYIDCKTISKFRKFPFFDSKNPENGLKTILNHLKLQQIQKNFSNKKGLAGLSSILKDLLISSLTKKTLESLKIMPETIKELEKIHLWLSEFNKICRCSVSLMNFQIICDLLNSKDENFREFKEMSLNPDHPVDENFTKKLMPSPEDSFSSTSIKSFFLKLWGKKKTSKPENFEKIFTFFFTSLQNANQVQLFEGFQCSFSLFKSKILSQDFLFKHFLHFSGLIESQDSVSRSLCLNFLQKLASHSNSSLGAGCRGLIQQVLDQEQDFSVKSEIFIKPFKTLTKTFNSNIDFENFQVLFTRFEEVEIMKDYLQEKNFVEICGKQACGKTSLALHYSKVFKNDYDVIWVVDSEHPEKDLDQLAEVLECLPGSLKGLMEKLRRNDAGLRILIVFDNADDLALVNEFMIKSKTVHFIVVTGKNVWKNSVCLDLRNEKIIEQYLKLFLFFKKSNEESVGISENLKNDLLCYSLALNLVNFEKFELILSKNMPIRDIINSMIIEYFTSSSNPIKYILSILSFLYPVNIPESLIFQVFTKKFSKAEWKKSKTELINNGLVSFSSLKENYWKIHEEVSISLCNFPKEPSLYKDLLDYFYLNFTQSTEETFHPLTFQVLTFFYFSDSSKLSIKTSIVLVKNLLKINFNQKIITEILEILDENTHELTQTDKSKDSLDLFRVLSDFALQVKNEDRSYSLFFDYLKEFEALSSQYPEEYLLALIDFNHLGEKMQDSEASHHYFDQVLNNSKFDSCSNLGKVFERYSQSLIVSLKFPEAESVLNSALEKLQPQSDSSETIASLNNTLGFLYYLQEKPIESQSVLLKSKKILESLKKTGTTEYLSVLELLSEVFELNSESESRKAILEEALGICWHLYPPTHPELIFIASQLAQLHLNQTGQKSTDYFSYYSLFTSHHKDQTSLGASLSELDFHSHYSTTYHYKRGIQLIQKGLQTFADLSET